ncbi:hypothetical protein Tco_0185983, partial [Tanacetum coccineum]
LGLGSWDHSKTHLGIPICQGNVLGMSLLDVLHVLLDARIDIYPALGLHMRRQVKLDQRLSLRQDLLPRRVVQRHLLNELPKVVRPMRRMVTERHQGLFVVPLKPDRDRAFVISLLAFL